MEANIQLRCLERADLPAADKLRQAAGWNQTREDWLRLLACDPEGCFAAVEGSEVVGTASTTSFGADLAWIGMVLVDPTRRNLGIGRKLLMKSLDHLQGKGVRCIKLDATPAGQVLYEKLGFKVEWPLERWMIGKGERGELVRPSERIISADDADWNEIAALDRLVFGVDRSRFLKSMKKASPRSVIFRGSDGKLEGFAFARPGMNADYLGPVVAQNKEAGRSIVGHLLASTQSQVYWDIPGPCLEAAAFAKEIGFVSQRSLVRMYFGDNAAVGIPRQAWGISDPATG